MLMLMLRMPGLFSQPWPERRAPAPRPSSAASRLLPPFTLPRAQLCAQLEETSVAAGRLAGLVLARLDRLVLAWRQVAAVAFDSESGCLLLDFVDVALGAKLQVQVGRRADQPLAPGAGPPVRPRGCWGRL